MMMYRPNHRAAFSSPDEEHPMKTLIFIASLSTALIAWPAIAQQGPAGVPGAYGLAESVAPAPPSAKGQRAKRGPADCSNARNIEQCKARHKARKKMLEACKDRFGVERKQCLHEQAQAIDCTQAHNPLLCESRKQAYAGCQNQNGAQSRQCVQQKMPPADCSQSTDPARCEQHQKARLLCQDKAGQEHRQCLRDNLTAKK
jgi:hypothetical protein